MTNNAATFMALAERCEQATGPSRAIEIAITEALLSLSDERHECINAQWIGEHTFPYTASLDAIVSLIERELPGECWRVESAKLDFRPCASIGTIGPNIDAATPVLALAAAFLRAKASLAGEDAK